MKTQIFFATVITIISIHQTTHAGELVVIYGGSHVTTSAGEARSAAIRNAWKKVPEHFERRSEWRVSISRSHPERYAASATASVYDPNNIAPWFLPLSKQSEHLIDPKQFPQVVKGLKEQMRKDARFFCASEFAEPEWSEEIIPSKYSTSVYAKVSARFRCAK